MAESTGISWCRHTWSPVWGCTQISPACDHCYAKTLAHRFGTDWNGAPMREFGEHHWKEPIRWNRRAAEAGRRATVFPSMCDPFDKDWPTGIRERFWALIDATPHLDWLLLTKRVGNVARMVPTAWMNGKWPPNAWLGETVANQSEADRDIAKVLALPAPVRFLSIEPLLGPVDISRLQEASGTFSPLTGTWYGDCAYRLPPRPHDSRIHWVIVGAESGPHARPLHVNWVREIVRQCKAARVPVHVKQLGREVHDDGMSSPGEHWPAATVRHPLGRLHESDPAFVVRLNHAKGGDTKEWPEDLRVQEFPCG